MTTIEIEISLADAKSLLALVKYAYDTPLRLEKIADRVANGYTDAESRECSEIAGTLKVRVASISEEAVDELVDRIKMQEEANEEFEAKGGDR
jgi:hypothetical protein